MTIKQIYLVSAALLCAFGCHASESNERKRDMDREAKLGQNVPVLAQPENVPVLAFLCEMRSENCENIKNIFDQTIALNTDNMALMKKLPQIVFEALNNHQSQHNRLHRKQIESEDNLDNYNKTLCVFEDCLETLKQIDTCIPKLFLATDLTAIEQLLKKFRQTQSEYDNWCYKIKRARRTILEKIDDAISSLIPVPLIVH